MSEAAEQQSQNGPALQSQPATLSASIQIIRAGTGKVETYDLVLTPAEEQPKEAE